jgi:hypothetical protein
VLSDGTLRMLALATLKNDPQQRGVLCFEEPENGVHPFRLKNIAYLLRELTTNFQDESQVELPLRQLLVNTHSPTFISQTDVRDVLLFAYMVTRVGPQEKDMPPHRVTHIVQVAKTQMQLKLEIGISKEEENYTLDQIKKYLNSDTLNEASSNLIHAFHPVSVLSDDSCSRVSGSQTQSSHSNLQADAIACGESLASVVSHDDDSSQLACEVAPLP